jgi:hypothetical protein
MNGRLWHCSWRWLCRAGDPESLVKAVLPWRLRWCVVLYLAMVSGALGSRSTVGSVRPADRLAVEQALILLGTHRWSSEPFFFGASGLASAPRKTAPAAEPQSRTPATSLRPAPLSARRRWGPRPQRIKGSLSFCGFSWFLVVFLGGSGRFSYPLGPILESLFLWRCFCRQKPPCKM